VAIPRSGEMRRTGSACAGSREGPCERFAGVAACGFGGLATAGALSRSLLARRIAQASHAAPELGLNIRPDTLNRWWAALDRTGV
jgi:hypothetical protein